MSWSEAGRRLLGLALLLVALAGCGFEPLYRGGGTVGPRPDGPVAAELATVRVAPIPDRVGQQLRNDLAAALAPAGGQAAARYMLEIGLSQTRRDLAIEEDATTTFAQLAFAASFALRDLSSGQVVHRGVSRSTTSFNLVRSNFANIAAEADARERAARELSYDIVTRLALFFRGRSAG